MIDPERKALYNDAVRLIVKHVLQLTNNDFAKSMVLLETVVTSLIQFFEVQDQLPCEGSLDQFYEGVQMRIEKMRADAERA